MSAGQPTPLDRDPRRTGRAVAAHADLDRRGGPRRSRLIGSRLLSAAPTPSGDPRVERRGAARVAVRRPSPPSPSASLVPSAAPTPVERPRRPPDPAIRALDDLDAAIAAARGGRDGLKGKDANDLASRVAEVRRDLDAGDRSKALRDAKELDRRVRDRAKDLDNEAGDQLTAASAALLTRPRRPTRRRAATDRRIMGVRRPPAMTRIPMTAEAQTPADRLRPLRRTRQVRQFEPAPVDPAILDALADVARWTGSSSNSQPWRFIVITEPSTLRALHEAGLPQTRGLETAPAAIAIVLPSDPGCGPSTTPTTTGASPSGCSSPPRSSTSAPGSAGSARTSGRPRARSSACRMAGWSGRSSRSVIRPRRPGRPSRRPARPVSRGARPCSRSAGRPTDARAGRAVADRRSLRRDAAPPPYGPLTRSRIGGSAPSYPPPR